ncbi:MAG TPA: acyl-CoA dehydrogenase family protein [Thermoanaerobaculia bacterium]|nr:acyl-CoA dehydrogenase family protein [Thermoanaerobaculia bacterium]
MSEEAKSPGVPDRPAAPRRPTVRLTRPGRGPEPEPVVKWLLAGQIPEDTLFPYPEVSAEERETVAAFLETLRAFAKERIDPARFERERHIPPEVVRGLAELGAFGMTIPEAYGGYGFSSSAYCRITEEIGTIDASLGILVGGHQSIGMKALVLHGSEEQKKRWLPALAAGEMIAAFALTEPEAGSDAASIQTTAVLDEAAGVFVLNGTKHWISNGGFAEFFTVFARDVVLGAKDAHRGITAFAVTKSLGGVVPGPEEKKLGLKASSTVPIQLENVRVPLDHVIGERGQGFRIAVEVLNTGRTSLGAGCIGGSRRLMREAMLHATQRRQFGTRIADFEMIREKFARMVVSTYALESMVYMTAGLIDRGLEDYALEGACCKIFGTEAVWRTINDALQIAGGNGFMEEYPFERALRDSRINMIFEGTNEILRVLIALSGMRDVGEDLKEVGRALRAPLTSFGILSEYAARKLRDVVPARLTKVAPPLAAEAEVVSRYARAAGGAVETLLKKYGKGVIEKEYHQERLANVAIELYASLCTLSRASAAYAKRGAEKADDQIRIARAFVQGAKYRMVGLLKEMDKNRDAERTAISEMAYAGLRYPFPLWDET